MAPTDAVGYYCATRWRGAVRTDVSPVHEPRQQVSSKSSALQLLAAARQRAADAKEIREFRNPTQSR